MRQRIAVGSVVLWLAAAASAAPPAPKPAAAPGPDIGRFLQFRSATGPTVSPDGREVAFLTDLTGSRQVWVVPSSGGYPEQWTFFPDRVSFVRWSPTDPDTLLVGKDTDGNERTQLFLLSRGGRRITPLTDRPEAIFRFGHFSDDGTLIGYASNKRDPKHFDVYVLDLRLRVEKLVHRGEGSHSAGRFSPDSRRMIVERTNGGGDDQILIVDLATGRAEEVTPVRPARYESVHWSADGRSLTLLTDAGTDFIGRRELSLSDRTLSPAGTGRNDAEFLVRDPDGGTELVAYNCGGYSQVRLQAGPWAAAGTLTLPAHAVVSGASAKRNRIALAISAPNRPTDVWMYDAAADELLQLTKSSTAGLAPEELSVPRTVTIRSFDGLEFPAFLHLPAGANKDGSLPVVIDIHGGPESQRRPYLSPFTQYLVARGFAVLEPNVRGSTGYGKAYEKLDNVRRRLDSVRDVKAALDWLKASGWVHPKRIAVMGGSYGGYMTLAAITEYPGEWAAAIELFGISDFEAFLRNTGAYRRHLREAEYGSLEKDLDFLRSVSPIRKVNRIVTPLMVIQGANDPRVPQSESDAIVSRLRGLGRPVDYLLFPDEGHGIAKMPNRIRAYRAMADFLEKHVKNRQ